MGKINHGRATNQRVNLKPDKSTTHMTTKCGEGYTVDQMSFRTGGNFKELAKKAIPRAPKKEATGSDEKFSEASMCASIEAADLLTSIW